jgi:uncharacterized protein with GYD domain
MFLEVIGLIFIVLGKWRKPLTKEMVHDATSRLKGMEQEGIRWIGNYWTMGRYDFVTISEAKDEKTFMETLIRWTDLVTTETLVALPRTEAVNLIR